MAEVEESTRSPQRRIELEPVLNIEISAVHPSSSIVTFRKIQQLRIITQRHMLGPDTQTHGSVSSLSWY